MKITCFVLLLTFSTLLSVKAQNTFDVQFPQQSRNEICQRFNGIFRQKPKEINFSIQKDESNNLFFEINDTKWFNLLFQNPGDGIAIDVVTKDRYTCEQLLLPEGQIRGELLRPVYSNSLKKTLKKLPNGRYRTRVGKLPQTSTGKDLEFNILFLSDKNLCRYQTIFDLEAYQLDLLDMGMYLDSIVYRTKLGATGKGDQYTLKYKTLTFTIPFEKNKASYSQEDIKPLYDSLRLTDFNIKKINIRAYSSIEGNLQRNIQLQEQRAKSIVAVLQAFQKPTIVTEVSSSENWVEFLNDITGTPQENLKNLGKEQIKARVTGETATALEKYLKNHRKAVISLDLEKKDRYKDKPINELITLFNTAIGEEQVDEASDLQTSIFEKLKSKEADPDVLNQLRVPKQLKYLPFFNDNSAMRYLLDERNMLIAYNEFLELEKLAPKDRKVKYNLVALALQLWRYNVKPFDDSTFKKQIEDLKNYGIAPFLIQRMMVNYHIVLSEVLMRKGDYVNKDRSVEYIYTNYVDVPLTDYDYLSLSQYLSYYSNLDKAVMVLQEKVKQIEVNENLLFYYLNLTLIDKKLTQQVDYRTIMLNAINVNKSRFCRLFNAFRDGGVTFQLLEDDYLRNTYCENCDQ